MRRFLRRLADGGNQAALTPHHSLGFDGSHHGLLSNPNGTRFPMPAIGSGLNTTVAAWVLLHSKATPQRFWQLDDGSAFAGEPAAHLLLGMVYDPISDHFLPYQSNGTNVSFTGALFSPVVDTWYLLRCTHGPTALAVTAYDASGQIGSWSTGTIGAGFNAVTAVCAVGSGSNGYQPCVTESKIDSLGIWPDVAPPDGLAIWNNGKAVEWGALPASSQAGATVWLDFNEPSGSLSYADRTMQGNMSASSVFTRETGAGF